MQSEMLICNKVLFVICWVSDHYENKKPSVATFQNTFCCAAQTNKLEPPFHITNNLPEAAFQIAAISNAELYFINTRKP